MQENERAALLKQIENMVKIRQSAREVGQTVKEAKQQEANQEPGQSQTQTSR